LNFEEALNKHNIKYVCNLSTSRLSSIKAGGIAKYVVYPINVTEIALSIKICESFAYRYKMIGASTNTFFSDNGFDGVIICTRRFSNIKFSDTYVIADAGISLAKLLKNACENGIYLAEGLYGIPGTLGGAAVNNAGAYGASLSDIFEYGYFYDVNNAKYLRLDSNELEFSYRSSILKSKNLVLLKAILKGTRKDSSEISRSFEQVMKKRKDSQPSLPSLGSFFKRNQGVIPSHLIDKAGLKGLSFGGAEVSQKHAGFIVNTGNATATDIDTLAKKIEKIILEKYNVTLLREAELVE